MTPGRSRVPRKRHCQRPEPPMPTSHRRDPALREVDLWLPHKRAVGKHPEFAPLAVLPQHLVERCPQLLLGPEEHGVWIILDRSGMSTRDQGACEGEFPVALTGAHRLRSPREKWQPSDGALIHR